LARALSNPQSLRKRRRRTTNIIGMRRGNADVASVIVARAAGNNALGSALMDST
jgi:hypothetical protein